MSDQRLFLKPLLRPGTRTSGGGAAAQQARWLVALLLLSALWLVVLRPQSHHAVLEPQHPALARSSTTSSSDDSERDSSSWSSGGGGVRLPGARQCVGWKETIFCHPFAERFSDGDKSCDEPIIPQVSGFCLCEGNVTAARITCGPKSFTCRERCAALAVHPADALVLPTLISCPYSVPYRLADYVPPGVPVPDGWHVDTAAEAAKASAVWRSLWAAVHRHDMSDVRAPATRNFTHDFVREGRRLDRSVVRRVRGHVDGFKRDIPAYPAATFAGKGVVIVGGGLKYIITAWVVVHQLRATGCMLPIEMWFPPAEAPTQEAEAALRQLGVSVRLLDVPGLRSFNPYEGKPKPAEEQTKLQQWHEHRQQQQREQQRAAQQQGAKAAAATSLLQQQQEQQQQQLSPAPDDDPEHMARFTIKATALLLSRFEQVLYLDADNIPVRDPSQLFASPQYNASGVLFWQDYWESTVAPQVADMLRLPRRRWFAGSFESGQLVVDKRRHWQGLALAVYFNSYATFWYEMFTCFLGKGDKETFAYAMLAAGEPIHVVPSPPGSLGTTGTSMTCSPTTFACKDEFTGNTMVQRDLAGRLMFLHSNLHKWDMRLPEAFGLHYHRRWARLMPEDVDFEAHVPSLVGYDVENSVYRLIRQLKCQPWWQPYYDRQVAKGDRQTPQLDGFHFLLRGIELDKLYVRGWRGNYVAILRGTSARERVQHWFNGRVRPSLVGWGLLQPF